MVKSEPCTPFTFPADFPDKRLRGLEVTKNYVVYKGDVRIPASFILEEEANKLDAIELNPEQIELFRQYKIVLENAVLELGMGRTDDEKKVLNGAERLLNTLLGQAGIKDS